jgi:hypothetical protein
VTCTIAVHLDQTTRGLLREACGGPAAGLVVQCSSGCTEPLSGLRPVLSVPALLVIHELLEGSTLPKMRFREVATLQWVPRSGSGGVRWWAPVVVVPSEHLDHSLTISGV